MINDTIIYILLGVSAALFLVISNLRIVPQSTAVVMERLGVYSRTWHTGLHIKIPFIEKPARKITHYTRVEKDGIEVVKHNYGIKYGIDLKEQLMEIDPKQVITKDNIDMHIDAVIFYQITDPMLYIYGHRDPEGAIREITATTLRNLVGDLDFDETLVSRDHINSKMRVILDEAANAWGIRVTRVEVQNIIPPKSIADAMLKQMTAERERRAKVIEAEGKRKAAILEAEGTKQAAILVAEGEKQKRILEAEGRREAMICEAEGEAEAILQVEQAKAEGIKMINASEPTKEYLTIKSLDSLAEAAQGESNTIIIPSEIQSLAGLAKSASEVFKA